MRAASLFTLLTVACGGPTICPTPVASTPAARPLDSVLPAQEQVATVDDGTVRLEGASEIPDELRARLQQYLETRSALIQDVNHDGSEILITTRFANTAQLHRVHGAMGDRQQLTFGSDPIAAARYWPEHANEILLQHDHGGDENYQLYVLDLATGRERMLTNGTSRNPSFAVTRDGRKIFYTSNARNGTDFDLWQSDGSNAGRLILERHGDFEISDTTATGDGVLLIENISIADTRIHLAMPQSDEASPTPIVAYSQGGSSDRFAIFGPQARGVATRTVLFGSDRDREFVALRAAFAVPVAVGGSPPRRPEMPVERLLSENIPWNAEQAVMSGDGHALAAAFNVDGLSRILLYSADPTELCQSTQSTSAEPRSQLVTVSGVVLGLRAAQTGSRIFATISGPAMSGDVFMIDTRTRRVERWTQSEMGGLDATRFVQPTLIHYPSFDGREIPAFVYPARERQGHTGPKPVLISIHGGPEAQALPLFSPLIQYLALEEGTTVVVPNVRGSDGYGKSYLALDNFEHREDSVRDIGALLDWVGTQPDLDAQRVAVMGGSYGGYMVLASLTHYSARLRAGIDIVGISNFVTFLENTAPYRRELRRVEYGNESEPTMRTFLQEASPLTHVDRISAPLFVAQGANDPRVPASEAEQIVQAVRGAGHSTWYMLARNEGHGFVRKANRDVFTSLSVLFLREHLLHTDAR